MTKPELDAAQVRNTQDFARTVPNFSFSDSGLRFANLLSIRGIGSSSALIAPSVNYYVDGLPVPARMFDQRLIDVSRIEVLRGPQGTLFGLNSQAGAVNITTEDPGPAFGGAIGSEFGSFGRRRLDMSVGGPLTENVGVRLSGQLYGYDGDIRNTLFTPSGGVLRSERDVREELLGAISGKVVLTPNADTRVTLFGNYRHDRQRPTTGVLLDDLRFPRNAFNPVPRDQIESGALGLKIEHDFGWARFTSITGFQRYDLSLKADILDGFIANAQTGLPFFAFQDPTRNVRQIRESSDQLSQELRLDGTLENGTRWVAGVSGLVSGFQSTTDITSMALPNGAYRGRLDTANLAAFGEVTVPITDRLRLIAGLRLTYEGKDFEGLYRGRPGPPPVTPLFAEARDRTDVFLTGRTGLAYDVTSDLTAFATIARGEKPGGFLFFNQFAPLRLPIGSFRNSETWSYEAGLKGRPLGDWLEVAATAFFNDTRNEQLFTFNPLVGRFDVQNADTQSYGAEIEARARLSDRFSLAATLGLLQTEITGSRVRALIGNEVPYAPPVTASIAAEYLHPLTLAGTSGSLFGRVEYQVVGGREIDPANSRRLPGYDLVNLRAGWRSEKFDLYGYVENLADSRYALTGFQAGTTATGRPVFAGVPGLPRTLGLGARYRF